MKDTARTLVNRIEFPILLAGLVIAGGLWGFVELMEVARAGPPRSFDADILLAFRQAGQPNVPVGPLWLEGAMRDITSLGSASVLVLITTATIIYFLLVRQNRPAGRFPLRSLAALAGEVPVHST